MKLIYAADIHGAFEKVKTLLYETVADVYIIFLDLILYLRCDSSCAEKVAQFSRSS
jgi:hypothetical protein